MSELAPCPFCGKKAVIEQTGRREVAIKCVAMCVKHKQKTLKYDTEWLTEKMIEAWNKRVIPEGYIRLEDVIKIIENTYNEKRYFNELTASKVFDHIIERLKKALGGE